MATSSHILIQSRLGDALAGDPGACFDLGIAHSRGSVAEANRVEAYKWFDLAASRGYSFAETYRARLASGMSRREIAEARRRLRLLEISHGWQIARFSASLFD